MSLTKTSDKNKTYLEKDSQFVNQVLARCAPIVAHKASGSYVYDMNDEAYLDFTTGIAVTNTGHCHPKVVKAIIDQASKLLHTSVTTYHKNYIDLAEKLVSVVPKGLDRVFLANSGAEAVEGAIKLARYVTGRPAIINFKGSFHGRTLLTTALTTSKLYYRENYEPLPGSIFTVPYPYVFGSQFKDSPQKCVDNVFEHLDTLFNQFVSPSQVAAMIIEPILGEGGYVVPPDGFLTRLRKFCTDHKILLIIDEVQSGFGRSGKMFACQYDNIEPDIMLMAKGIASGMPLSAFVAKKEIADKWPQGRHGNTFGGNPVSCAAALATLEVIEEEKLLENCQKVGDFMLKKLREILILLIALGLSTYGCVMNEEVKRINMVKNNNNKFKELVEGNLTGKQIFIRSCNTCHPGGKKSSVAPDIRDFKTIFKTPQELKEFIANGKNHMPAQNKLTSAELNNIVEYMYKQF